MEEFEIKVITAHGVKGRPDDVLASILIPPQGYPSADHEEIHYKKVLKLFNDVKDLYYDHQDGEVTATLTIIHESVKI